MGNFVTIKAGDADNGLEMYSTENYLRLEKEFDGDPIKVKSTPSPIIFPMSSVIWGKRVKDETTKKPTGEIVVDKKWWEGRDDGYEAIRTQYHPTFNSFDLEYQRAHKANLRDTSDDLFYEIPQGLTAFEAGTNLAEFLAKFHSANGSNVSRSPDVLSIFEMFDASAEMEDEFDKEMLVVDAIKDILSLKGDDARANAYANVFGLGANQSNIIIIKGLRDKAKANIEDYNKTILNHKTEVERLLTSAEANEIMKFTTKGNVQVLDENSKYQIVGKVTNYKNPSGAIKGIAQKAFDVKNLEVIRKVKEALENYKK